MLPDYVYDIRNVRLNYWDLDFIPITFLKYIVKIANQK